MKKIEKSISFTLLVVMLLNILSFGLVAKATSTLSPGTANRTSDSEATVTFTSSEEGQYYYEVVEDDEGAPTIDTSGSGVSIGVGTYSISLSTLLIGAKDIYITEKDGSGSLSNKLKIDIPEFDNTSPTLTANPAYRISESIATISITSNEACEYYYEIVDDNASAPAIDTSVSGTSISSGTYTISPSTLSTGAKDFYITAKDAAGNVSDAIKIDIDAYKKSGLYLTEIYPNDVDRSAVYGNASDHMEYVELTNTTNTDISFNNEYGLYYEYPSGSTYVFKKLT